MKIKLLLIFLLVFSGKMSIAQYKPIPRDTTYNVKKVHSQIKRDYPYAIPVPDQTPANVTEARDLIYAHLPQTPFGPRDLHLDIFRPKKKGKYPALLMIHGGGWRSGEKSMQVPLAQLIANKGFVTIPVEYQLSLEAPYPAAVHNIKAAIRWVKAHAQEFDIDTTKMAISGCSAGGHLASLVGLTGGVPRFEGTMGNHLGVSTKLQAIVDIDGVINFLAPSSLNLERKSDSPDAAWLGGVFSEKPLVWKEASPAYWITEKSVPMLFLNSGYSRFHAGQDELIGQYKEWGIYQEVHQFNVKVHPFWLFHPWADESAQYMADFLKKVL
ncbi:alpha/beta hydrolase [Flectobacillus rivi]|uniref:Alpha/beta hydrolase n=1 Tax=Flectobacillus rivi TaxID=2984209 RepID=A0ABT6Z7B4_9BACT|nr:alpha/beta hydrolase [Flectobacillus rivi]MDI9876476.1 alpha/beta hydrolase [Flectobacillus rivi]